MGLSQLGVVRHVQANLVAAVEEFIADGAAPAERMIRDLVACEHSYINTDHPAFIGGSRAIAQVPLKKFTGCNNICPARRLILIGHEYHVCK